MILERTYRVRYTENGHESVAPVADCVKCAQDRMVELEKVKGVTDVHTFRVNSAGWCDKH